MKRILVLLALSLTPLTPTAGLRGQAMDSLVRLEPVRVTLAAPPASAFDKSMVALVSLGYQIEAADKAAGTIRTLGKVQVPTGGGLLTSTVFTQEWIYRVTVLATGDTATVVLDMVMTLLFWGGDSGFRISG